MKGTNEKVVRPMNGCRLTVPVEDTNEEVVIPPMKKKRAPKYDKDGKFILPKSGSPSRY